MPPPLPLPLTQVKFALHFFNYINYMLYSAIALWISGAEGEVTVMELILWVWAASRQVGELFELDEWSYAEFRLYARDGWNQLDTATFLLIMSAAVVRITTCGLDFSGGGGTCAGRGTEWEEAHDGAKWEGDTVDYIARNVYAVGVLCIWLRLLQFIQYEQTVGEP